MREKQRQQHEAEQRRYFDTTTGSTHVSQDMHANTVGRKVMKTQDGGLVKMEDRDLQFIVEHGIYRRL